MLTKLTYFGPEHFPPTQDSETLHGLSFGQYKMVPERGYMFFFFSEPVCLVQMKLHVKFQNPRQSGSAPDRNKSTLLT